MNSVYNVIIRPVVSERSFDLMNQNKYTFEVAKQAPKEEIADAVEKLFDVRVVNHLGEAQDQARPLPGWQDPFLEEGHRDCRRGRFDRALRPAGCLRGVGYSRPRKSEGVFAPR